MKLLKKSSAAIISFMCLLVIVGYINYEYNQEREANLGQSVYVLSKEGEILKEDKDNKDYLFSASNNIYNIINKINDLKIDLKDINIDDIKLSYDFQLNKYIIILPKELESKNEEILSLISKYVSLEKVIVKYE